MSDLIPWLLVANLASTLFLTGLIWFVQVVHYPMFDGIGEEQFTTYENRHRMLTTWVVAIPMLTEAFTSVALVRWSPASAPAWMLWTGVALVFVIWVTTAVFSVPAHGILSHGFNRSAHRRLVLTNWIRTTAWTARSGILVVLAWPAIVSTAVRD